MFNVKKTETLVWNMNFELVCWMQKCTYILFRLPLELMKYLWTEL